MSSTFKLASAIHSFPPEILSSIFKLVHISTLELPDASESSSHISVVEDDESEETSYMTPALVDPFPPSTFPYSLASVCTFWRNVMSAFPAFWTSLVIFVDSSNPSSLSDVRSHLEWSNKLPLRVVVTRHKDKICGTDESEEARVKEVTALLGPHIHRCHDIRYIVLHSNSLPSIPTHFRGPLSHLKELHLVSFRQSLFPDPIYRSPAAYTTSLSLPALRSLQSLSMDGRNFVNLCLNFPDWITLLPPSGSHSFLLDISQFQASDCIHRFSLFDALAGLAIITRVICLKLNALEFDCDLSQLGNHDFNNLFIKSLGIMDLSAELTAGLLYDGYSSYFHKLKITRCPLNLIKWQAPYSYDLTLEDVVISEVFCSYLSTWKGSQLTFNNCPSLNDHALEKLSALVPHSPGPKKLFAYRIRALHIHDCSNFSFATFRRIVEERNARVPALNNGIDRYSDINFVLEHITITGRRPFLYPDDRTWLALFPRDNLDKSTWPQSWN